MGSILVLADRYDSLAGSVAAALKNARQPVRLVTPLELSLEPAWTSGDHGNGAGFQPAPRAVLNRLHAARSLPGESSGTLDVAGEAAFSARVGRWIASLRCLVLGPTSASLPNIGLMGWLAAARDAWLPTPSGTVVAEPITSMRPVYVVDGEVIGAPDASLEPALQRLAERVGCNLLECRVGWTGTTPGRWVFCDATSVPLHAPPQAIDAIVGALAGARRLRQSSALR